jgi:hypothetical protein
MARPLRIEATTITTGGRDGLVFTGNGGKKTGERHSPNRCGWNRVQSTRFKTTQFAGSYYHAMNRGNNR